MEILRDVMAAVARADDESGLFLPSLAILVFTGVQNFTAEIAQPRNIRNARDAAHAGRHHDVARVHLPRPVGETHQHRPSLRRFIVTAACEFAARPIVEFHALHIGLEPGGQLVLGDVGRPVRRERHVGQMIDVHLIVQDQRVIALAPVVADARFPVDDQRRIRGGIKMPDAAKRKSNSGRCKSGHFHVAHVALFSLAISMAAISSRRLHAT
jgi:hypothetical protein